MRLATEADVVQLMGAVDNEGSRSNAAIALDVSAPVVSEKIGTPLEAATYTDFFSYQIPIYRRAFSPVVFRLSAGFIDPATVVVRESLTGAPLADGDTGTVVPKPDYYVDPIKGTFTLLRDVVRGYETLTVKYAAGFDQGSDGALAGIPDWLRRGGIVAACKLLQMNPAHFVARKALIMKDVQSAFLGEVSAILNPHMRPRIGFVWPDRFTSEQ